MGAKRKYNPIKGDKFVNWIFIEEIEPRISNNGKPIRRCLARCNYCNTIKEVGLPSLFQNGSKSCCGLSRRKEPGLVSVRSQYNSYRNNARNRGIDFDLSFLDFKYLIFSNCYYCKTSPSRYYNHYTNKNGNIKKRYRASSENVKLSTIYVNGVDRANNNLGYISSNCVPCCSICNTRKKDASEKEFLDWVLSVYNNRIKKS
jgi:hypothetical protein